MNSRVLENRPTGRPLAGRRIVVTRTPERAGELIAQLTELGAEAIPLPTIAFEPVHGREITTALRQWSSYDACIFTSAHAVSEWFGRAGELGLQLGAPPAWACAVGAATAAELERTAGWPATVVPADYHADGVVAALADVPMRGLRIVFPHAAEGRNIIHKALLRWGALVEHLAIYRTITAEASRPAALKLFPLPPATPGADAVILTSGSTANALAELLGTEANARLAAVALGVLGPITRVHLKRMGWPIAFQARSASMGAMVMAAVKFFDAGTSRG